MLLFNNGSPQRHRDTEVSEGFNLTSTFFSMIRNYNVSLNKFARITLSNNPLRLCASVAKITGDLL